MTTNKPKQQTLIGELSMLAVGSFIVGGIALGVFIVFGDAVYLQTGKFSEIENTFTSPIRFGFSLLVTVLFFASITTRTVTKFSGLLALLFVHLFLIDGARFIAKELYRNDILILDGYEYAGELLSAVVLGGLFAASGLLVIVVQRMWSSAATG